jgi:hypothetical protein
MNPIRRHAMAFLDAHGGTIEQAALRVFGNAESAYGANVNQMVEGSLWEDEDELGEAYLRRKGFAYGLDGKPARQDAVMRHILGSVEAAYQNLTASSSASPRSTTTSTRWAASAKPCSAPAAAPRPRSMSATRAGRGHGPHARRAGRARDPHPHPQSALVRAAARARA